jgi:hypothetical protein
MNESQEDILYTWTAQEFIRSQRGRGWYWGAAVIILVALAYAVWVQQWTFVAVILMAAVAVYLLGRVAPRQVRYALLPTGIRIGQQIYPYDTLKSFWVVDGVERQTIVVTSKRRLGWMLTLPMDNADIEQVRQILAGYLAEEEGRDEDVVDKFSRWLKL